MGMCQSVDVTATGTYLQGVGNMGLIGARLIAAAANATAVIRENDGAGKVLARLSAVPNTSDDWEPQTPVAFLSQVHVTLTGAGAALNLFA